MTTAADGAALFAAIKDDPADDLPRLAYADWLEEAGQIERAEFIRVQVALAGPGGLRFKCGRTRSIPWCGDPGCHWCHFHRRERALIYRLHLVLHAETPYGARCVLTLDEDARSSLPVLLLRRGFVERVVCTLDAWRGHGPAVVRAHPVRAVTLSDREPWVGSFAFDGEVDLWGWWTPTAHEQPHPYDLPFWLLTMLKLDPRRDARTVEFDDYYGMGRVMFGSPEAAVDAMSDALLRWAELSPEERAEIAATAPHAEAAP